MGYVILLWHSLSLPHSYFGLERYINISAYYDFRLITIGMLSINGNKLNLEGNLEMFINQFSF